MYKAPFAVIIFLFLLFSGSAFAQHIFIVLRDVPENPSVVVIPTTFTKDGLQYADEAEELILGMHIRLVQRPTVKEITESKGATKTEAESGSAAAGGKSLTERYMAYGESGADYALITDQETDRIKLVKLGTREILSSVGDFTSFNSEREEQFRKEGGTLGCKNVEEYGLLKMLQSAGLKAFKSSP